MPRIALVCSEPIRERMAGIGIRYLEFARRLPKAGIDAILVSPSSVEQMERVGLRPERIRRFERGQLAKILGDCDGIVAQGHLANDVLAEVPWRPTAIDLYDPFLVENLAYAEDRRSDPFLNDRASWQLQMSRGDFFLCSSEVQRMYYLGFLTALGRVNPGTLRSDPELLRLIAVVPFGLPEKLADHRPYLPPALGGSRRFLFGGLYDWYDPWTVLNALEILDRPELSVIFVRNPNPETTPQGLLRQVEQWAANRGWLGTRVQLIDWVPAERRFDLLHDVDALVATHPAGFETELSLRTRFLEAMLAGCPVVASTGGAMAGFIEQRSAGVTVPVGDPAALAACLAGLFADPAASKRRIEAGRAVAAEFSWNRAVQGLLPFCRAPWVDPDKPEISAMSEPESGTAEGSPATSPADVVKTGIFDGIRRYRQRRGKT